MSIEKNINTRIIQKHDLDSKWDQMPNFLPKKGEIIVYETSHRIKIGDGKTVISKLPFEKISWNDITNKPSAFTPSSHNHDDRYYTESEMNSKLAEKSNTNHIHTFDDLRRNSKENWSGSVSSIDRTLFNVNRACRTAFLPKEAIKIEISDNGGSSWKENTSSNKIGLFSMNRGFSLNLGSQKPVTTQNWARITIEPLERYAYVDTFYCWFSSVGHTCTCDIERSTIGDKDKFSYIRQNVPVSGWSGPNEISFSGGTFGGGPTQYSNNYKYRFTFKITKVRENYKNSLPSVTDLRLYGDSCWTASNDMMSNDSIFSWDNEQNVTFPKKIKASQFEGDADSVDGYHIEYENGYTSNNPTYICGFDTSKKKIKCASNGYMQGTLTVTGDITTNGARVIKEGDSRLTNSRPASDVYAWAKASAKPKYTYTEVGAASASHTHDDRYYTESEINSKLAGKANTNHTHSSGDITSLDAAKLTGTISIDRLPQGALERLVTVTNQAARFKLTSSNVQLGDTVHQLDNKRMYIVTDTSKLSSEAGYTEYTAGSAASVPWSGVSGKPSTFTPSSHTHDDRYYTESEINSKLAGKSNTGHTHDDRYYTESEMNSKLADKMTLHPNTIVMTPASGTYGCKIDFASNDQGYAYIHEDASDHLKICGNSGVNITAASDANIKLNGSSIATQTWVEGKGYATTDTKYSAGTGLSASGNTFNVKYGASAGTSCQGNDSRLSNSRPASDVYSWAKASTKPTYTADEIKFSDGETFQKKFNDGELKGSKGDTGARGPQGTQGSRGPIGINGALRSKIAYSPTSCLEYCTRKSPVSWSNNEVPDKGSEWTPGNYILFIIPCTNGDEYVSYQKVVSSSALQPISYWVSKKGSTGTAGVQGPRGATGATGSQGPQGLKGDTGARGPQGLKGDTGARGPQGLKGDTGARGPAGPTGAKGSTGPAGYTPKKGTDYFTSSDISIVATEAAKKVTPASIGAASASHHHTLTGSYDSSTKILTLGISG